MAKNHDKSYSESALQSPVSTQLKNIWKKGKCVENEYRDSPGVELWQTDWGPRLSILKRIGSSDKIKNDVQVQRMQQTLLQPNESYQLTIRNKNCKNQILQTYKKMQSLARWIIMRLMSENKFLMTSIISYLNSGYKTKWYISLEIIPNCKVIKAQQG